MFLVKHITEKNQTAALSCNSYTTPSPSVFIRGLILQSRIFSIDDVTDENIDFQNIAEICGEPVVRRPGRQFIFTSRDFFLTKRGNAVTEVKYLRGRIGSIFATSKKLFK